MHFSEAVEEVKAGRTAACKALGDEAFMYMVPKSGFADNEPRRIAIHPPEQRANLVNALTEDWTSDRVY